MRNIRPLPDQALAVYDEIVADKRKEKALLQALRPRVARAYARYDKWKHALQRVQPLGDELSELEQKALVQCYTITTIARDRIYKRIRGLAQGKCPYCTIDSISTLDHYLRKESYPELSILPTNLVPSCSECNRDRDFRSRNGKRALIHPYFDRIPRVRLLIAEVKVVRGVPEAEFSLTEGKGANTAFASLYRRHVDLLGLFDRYRRRAMSSDDGLYDIVSTVESWGSDRKDARKRLSLQADRYESTKGANHFKTALTRGAAASDEFLDFCFEGVS